MPPITFKNVNSTNNTGTLNAFNRSLKTLTGGIDSLGDQAQQFRNEQEQDVTSKFIQDFKNQTGTLEALQQVKDQGLFDPSGNSLLDLNQVNAAKDARQGFLQNQFTQQQAFDQAQQTANDKPLFENFSSGILGQQTEADKRAFTSNFLDQNPDLSASLRNQVATFGESQADAQRNEANSILDTQNRQFIQGNQIDAIQDQNAADTALSQIRQEQTANIAKQRQEEQQFVDDHFGFFSADASGNITINGDSDNPEFLQQSQKVIDDFRASQTHVRTESEQLDALNQVLDNNSTTQAVRDSSVASLDKGQEQYLQLNRSNRVTADSNINSLNVAKDTIIQDTTRKLQADLASLPVDNKLSPRQLFAEQQGTPGAVIDTFFTENGLNEGNTFFKNRNDASGPELKEFILTDINEGFGKDKVKFPNAVIIEALHAMQVESGFLFNPNASANQFKTKLKEQMISFTALDGNRQKRVDLEKSAADTIAEQNLKFIQQSSKLISDLRRAEGKRERN